MFEVPDGDAAVKAVEAGPEFDVIVLDAMMPKLSGREAYDRLVARGTRAVFLFSSGYSADMLPPQLLVDAGVEVIQKPYDPDALLRAVRAALDRRASR